MDNHCIRILEQYKDTRDVYYIIQNKVLDILNTNLKKSGIIYAQISSRIKTEDSLAGKLELKGYKYNSLLDITDIFGARISTLYIDEVDMVAAFIESSFNIDWSNSIDKRRLLDSDRFGYSSIHYICTIPKSLFFDEAHPEFNEIRFEIQIRTLLQDVWSTINHDLGYKTSVEIPIEYNRRISRLAGLLEIADNEFKNFRNDIEEYRKQVLTLVNDGKFDDISYNKDSFINYLRIEPFKRLNESIASSSKADITPANLMPYFEVFAALGVKTLGDIEKIIKDYSEDAKRLALHRIAGMELDIMASSIGVNNLCIVYALKNGLGENGLKKILDATIGAHLDHTRKIQRIMKQAIATNII